MNKVAFGMMVCVIMMVQAVSLFFPDRMDEVGGIGLIIFGAVSK